MDQEFIHPETSSGEVFFINTTRERFEAMDLKTKRKGSATYDGEGNPICFEDWFPVFIQDSELINQKTDLRSLRWQWRESQ